MNAWSFGLPENQSNVAKADFVRDSIPNNTSNISIYDCIICGRAAFCRHFGAYSCNACAAFFRRTVAEKKSFICKHYGNCDIEPLQNPILCPECRFRKCIAVGMQESEVRSLGAPRKSRRQTDKKKQRIQQSSVPVNISTLMPKPQKFGYNSNFLSYQNNEWLRKLLLVTHNVQYERMAILTSHSVNRKTSIPDISKHMLFDFRFCQMYLDETGILDIANDIVNENITVVMYYWTHLTNIFNTLQSGSITARKMMQIDHSMIEMSEESIRELYATDPIFHRHLDTVVNTSLPMWYRAEEIVKQIYTLGLTTEERAILMILSAIETVLRLSSEPRVTRLLFKPMYEKVFRSMHAYYVHHFSSDFAAVRTAELVMTLPLINVRLLYIATVDHLGIAGNFSTF
uniref:Nuclear receptor domain-containing protein n=1 Tax=Panagrellus redivivus TaxID=6233 RepID=A0A7E4W4E4_PANRE